MPNRKESRQKRSGYRNLVEWLFSGIGAVILGGSIVFLGYTAITRDDAPPSIRFRTQAIRAVTGGYLIELSLRNEGSETAANLMFEGRLIKDGQTVETSEATVDYVPSKSERQAGLFFENDPRRFEIRIQAKGYERP